MLAAIPEDEPPSCIREQQTATAKHVEEEQQRTLSSSSEKNDSTGSTLLRGVVFGRSVRSSFATFHVVRVNEQFQALNDDDDDEEEEAVLMIRLQFVDNATALRSYCRRFCKLGDLLRVVVQEDDTSNHNNANINNHYNMIEWQLPDDRVETDWRSPRLVVHVDSPEAAARTVPVLQRHHWSMRQCQRWQRLYLLPAVHAAAKVVPKQTIVSGGANNGTAEEDYDNETCATRMTPPIWMDVPSPENLHIGGNSNSSRSSSHHGGGLGKRTQGQYIASFLLHMLAARLQKKQLLSKDGGEPNGVGAGPETTSKNSIPSDPSQWSQQYDKLIEQQHSSSPPSPSLLQQARDYLNRARDNGGSEGGGVLDVAGGSGHVSMALSLLGVRCTVVDPRENVGRLPKRDRKVYHRALKQRQQQSDESRDSPASMNTDALPETKANEIYCQPVGSAPSTTTIIPFRKLRAWFGTPPDGIDTSFRHPDQDNLAAMVDDATLSRCTAIVALHPDEATDAIVDATVRWRIPFMIVPCCVFHRLFSHRRMPQTGEPVSTYQDLLEYLMAKDKSIQKTVLPFEGANTILWSCFADDEPLPKEDG